MSFRLRLTVLAALAVAAAIVGTSFLVYYTDRRQLIAQVDADLDSTPFLGRVAVLWYGPPGNLVRAGDGFKASAGGIPSKQIVLPRSQRAVSVTVGPAGFAAGRVGGTPHFSTQTVKGVDYRVLTVVLGAKRVVVTSSLVEVERNLRHLRWLLLLISLGGVGAAAILGGLVSGRAVAPLRRLTQTAERIVETGDLSARTGQRGRDEISRLSAKLDELLATAEGALAAQRRLVADASHELRTPIATLRANVELLAEPGALDAAERTELVSDVREDLESMTALVGELVELARGEEQEIPPSRFRLDELVRQEVERAQRRSPRIPFRTDLAPSVVTGVPQRIERAVANLLDNARKWSPDGSPVDVAVRDGLVEVRDRGPGGGARFRLRLLRAS